MRSLYMYIYNSMYKDCSRTFKMIKREIERERERERGRERERVVARFRGL